MDKKKLFCKIISALQEQSKKDGDFANATRKLNLFEEPFFYDNTLLSNLLVDIAEGLLTTPCDWVSWFCYENDYGEGNLSITIKEVEYFPHNAEELWDILETK